MKPIRLGSTLLVLALALCFSLTSVPYSSAAEDGGGGDPPKCNCRYPNPPEEYGVKQGTSCVVTDCWIDVT